MTYLQSYSHKFEIKQKCDKYVLSELNGNALLAANNDGTKEYLYFHERFVPCQRIMRIYLCSGCIPNCLKIEIKHSNSFGTI